MKSLYCLLLILVVSSISQAKQYYLRRSDANQILDVIRTYPELFDEVFAGNDIADDENLWILPPAAIRRESQIFIRKPKH